MSRLSVRMGRWALVVVLSAGLGAAVPVDAAQERLSNEQQADRDALLDLLDEAMAGQAQPDDIPLSWDQHVLKATEGQVYVPFTLTFGPADLSNRNISMLIRVVAQNGETSGDGMYAFQDIHFYELRGSQPYKVSRAFAVTPGEYDVYIGVKEAAGRGRGAAAEKMSVLKESLTVPDLWSTELATSSVIVADTFGPVSGELSEEERRERPYVLGNVEIVPRDDLQFGEADELTVVFLVYNAVAGADGKPNVTVNYEFHQRTEDGEEYFNRTAPQEFSSETLPAELDTTAGLLVGQSVPLGSFPAGDYRLEVRVVDNSAVMAITRDVFFTIQGN